MTILYLLNTQLVHLVYHWMVRQDDFILFYLIDFLFTEIDNLDPTTELGTIFKHRRRILSNTSTRENDKDRETVENIRYKSFQADVYNIRAFNIPIDVIDILDKVTRAQKFKVN